MPHSNCCSHQELTSLSSVVHQAGNCRHGQQVCRKHPEPLVLLKYADVLSRKKLCWGGDVRIYLWFVSEDAVLEAVELGRCCSSWTFYLLPYKVQLPISLKDMMSQP